MAFDAHANFAYATVDTAPTPAASGTSLTVATGTGALFPTAPFNAVIYPDGSVPLSTNAEIVRVTLVVGDVFTITRQEEGTSARTILAGDQIAAAITVRTLTDVETAIPSIVGLLSAVNVSAGATSNNLSALTFDNSNGVSFGLTGSVITATVATNYQSQGAYLTTAALSQDSSNYAGTNGAITGGSITVNTSGVSVNLPNYLTTAMASNRATDFVQATAVFHGTNASGTIASGAISVSVSAPAGNINVSAGTTSNLLTKVTFADSNGVSFGLNASTITATVKTDYQTSGNYLTTAMASNGGSDFVQATAAFAGTNASGTINSTGISVSVAAPAAASINFSAGTTSNNLTQVSFKDTNGVSFGIDAGTITATVKTDYQSSGNYLTTAMQSNAVTLSNIRVSAGATSNLLSAITFADGSGVSFGISASTITATVKTDYQTSGAYLTTAALSGDTSKYVQAWELTGNTSGTTSSAQGTKLYFSGGNSLTISGNSNTLVFSVGNYLTTAALSADSSKYAGTGFTSAGANIGLSGTHNTAGLSLSATLAAQSNQSAIKAFGVSNTGATAGNTGVSTGIDWVLAGSQSITLSQSTAVGGPNTVWLQHPAWLTTAALSADSSKYAGTGFTSAGNNIGLSGTHNTAGLSLSATVAAQTNQSIGIYASSNTTSSVSSGTVDARSITFVGKGDLSVGYSNGSVILSDLTYSTTSFNTVGIATTVNPVASANSTGTVTRWAPEDHKHAGVGGIGISTSGNTAGTTGSEVGTYWIQGGNSITVSQITSNNGSHTLVISAGNYLTTAALSGDTSKYAQEWALTGNTSGTTSSAQGTRWYFSGGANLTVSGNSNTLVFSAGTAAAAPVNFSAGATSNNLGSVVFSNSNGLSFGLTGSTITASASTVGTATTGAAVGSANSVGTVTRWVGEDHVHAGIGAIGISTGNTTGTSGSVQGTYWIAGGNGISVSQITSNNGSHTLVISNANAVRNFEPYRQSNTVGFALGAGTWYLAPFVAPGAISGGRINLLAVNTATAGIARDVTAASFASNTTGTKNQSATFSLGVALWSQGIGANSTRLESFWSNNFSFGLSNIVKVSVTGGNNSVSAYNSWSLSYISDIGSDGAYTLVQYANNTSTGATNTSQDPTSVSVAQSSIRNMLSNSIVVPIGFNTTIQEGEYWLGVAWSSTTASAVTNFGGTGGASALIFSHLSLIGISQLELNSAFRNFGSTATTARSAIFLGEGVMYTGGANMAPPQFIAISSDLSSLASAWMPYFNFQYRGLTK